MVGERKKRTYLPRKSQGFIIDEHINQVEKSR